MIGKVVGIPSAKTVKIQVVRLYRHPMYKKILRKTKNFLCHNEGVPCVVGDTVLVSEIAPVSKKKHFQLVKKV